MNQIVKNLSDTLVRKTQGIQKHSPELLLGAGIIGVVAGGVMACFATRKLDDVLEDIQIDVAVAHQVHEDESIPESGRTEANLRKDLAMAYGKGALQIAKLYGPSILVEIASIAAILTSHNIMTKRSVALAAAYSALDRGFRKYRDNVIEKFGEDADYQMRYGIERKKITEDEVDPETGKTKKVKKDIDVVDESIEGYSIYARFFDDSSREWRNDPQYNLMFARAQQAAANNMLKARGKLTLNEVYRMFDMQESDEGMIVGWEYDPEIDNKIDFKIYNIHRKSNRDFVNGYESNILLDFNVDGVICGCVK